MLNNMPPPRRQFFLAPLAAVLPLITGTSPALAGAPEDAMRAVSQDVRYANGDINLAAELLLPEAGGPHPAVVIAQGSGDSDRSSRWARDFAALFLGEGVAVLLTDKRGSGLSGGAWETSSLEALAGDTLAGAAFLRERPEIDPARIGVAGLSQGGKYAPLVGVMDADLAFVIGVSADAVTYGEQALHEMANMAREAGMPEPAVAGAVQIMSAAARYALNDDWPAYRESLDAAVNEPWAPIAETFPTTPDDPRWAFWRAAGPFDPMVYWPFVTQPSLILLGEDDESDNVAVEETVRRLSFGFAQARKTNFAIEIIPGAGHDAGVYSSPAATKSAIAGFLRAHGLAAEEE